jgi:hypothetical protein
MRKGKNREARAGVPGIRTSIVAGAALFLAAGGARAQAWDNPGFFSPRPGDDIGLYVLSPEFGDAGIAGIWRQSGNINLGVRAGIGGGSGDRTVLVGAEFFGPLNLETGTNLLLSWIVGAGASFDGVTWLRIPIGASIGIPLAAGTGFTILPYAHPRAALDVFAHDLGDGEEETDTEPNFDIDIGADFEVGPRWVIRVGASFGTEDTFGAGIAYRIPRRVVVR